MCDFDTQKPNMVLFEDFEFKTLILHKISIIYKIASEINLVQT